MEEKIKPVVRAPTRRERLREGRGFSLEEINRAGLTIHQAKKLEIPIDTRRKTAHVRNIQTLKEYFRAPLPLQEISGIGKVAEENLRSAGILDAYDLAYADITSLAEEAPHSKQTLKKWQSEAKKLLNK